MNKLSTNALGYTAAIVQAILYASMGIFSKLLYACGLNAQHAMMLRFAFTILFLGIFIAIFHERKFISKQPAVYIQSIFFFFSAWFYLLAVEHMNAGLTTVIFYAFPAVVAVMSVFVFHERFTWRIAVALVLSFVGVILISGIFSAKEIAPDPFGILFAILSCFAFATYSVLIQKTARVESSFTATFTLSLISLVASLVFFSGDIGGLTHIGLHEIALASGFAIFATILPIVLFIFAVGRIGATKASIVSLAEAPASLLLAWIILGETIDLFQALGSALIVTSILVVTFRRPKKHTSKDADTNRAAET